MGLKRVQLAQFLGQARVKNSICASIIRSPGIYGDMREWLLIAKKTTDEKFPKCPWMHG